MDNTIRRGDIYYADLGAAVGREQGGVRPVLVIQNDTGNRHSPTVIVAPITSKTNKRRMPTHVDVAPYESGLPLHSVILLEQLRTLDKARLTRRVGAIGKGVISKINAALAISIGI